jgi:hypothetical protein
MFFSINDYFNLVNKTYTVHNIATLTFILMATDIYVYLYIENFKISRSIISHKRLRKIKGS